MASVLVSAREIPIPTVRFENCTLDRFYQNPENPGRCCFASRIVQTVLNGGVDVDSSGDTATGRWYIQEQVVRSNGDRGILLAHYDDQYIKTTEGWKFSRRFLQPHYSGPHDLSSEFQCSADRLRERNVEGVDV